MFSILPLDDNFCSEDAQFYTNLELARDAALDWSVELGGTVVYIWKDYRIVAKVWA